ncbi:hypothetical protein BF16_03990 [Brucella suis 1330]|nr:hypothetical protein BF16_03990 [Brucella suis 1330]
MFYGTWTYRAIVREKIFPASRPGVKQKQRPETCASGLEFFFWQCLITRIHGAASTRENSAHRTPDGCACVLRSLQH